MIAMSVLCPFGTFFEKYNRVVSLIVPSVGETSIQSPRMGCRARLLYQATEICVGDLLHLHPCIGFRQNVRPSLLPTPVGAYRISTIPVDHAYYDSVGRWLYNCLLCSAWIRVPTVSAEAIQQSGELY